MTLRPRWHHRSPLRRALCTGNPVPTLPFQTAPLDDDTQNGGAIYIAHQSRLNVTCTTPGGSLDKRCQTVQAFPPVTMKQNSLRCNRSLTTENYNLRRSSIYSLKFTCWCKKTGDLQVIGSFYYILSCLLWMQPRHLSTLLPGPIFHNWSMAVKSRKWLSVWLNLKQLAPHVNLLGSDQPAYVCSVGVQCLFVDQGSIIQ